MTLDFSTLFALVVVIFLLVGSIPLMAVFVAIVAPTVSKKMTVTKHFRATQRTPIAQTSGLGPAHIYGQVLESEQGTLIVPITGQRAVWYRIQVHGYGMRREESAGRTFLLDDRSGPPARIDASNATGMVVNRVEVWDRYNLKAIPTSHPYREYLKSRGIPKHIVWRDWREIGCRVEMICPGDHITALGPSYRASPQASNPFNVPASSQLVLSANPNPSSHNHPAHPLYLSSQSPESIDAGYFGI